MPEEKCFSLMEQANLPLNAGRRSRQERDNGIRRGKHQKRTIGQAGWSKADIGGRDVVEVGRRRSERSSGARGIDKGSPTHMTKHVSCRTLDLHSTPFSASVLELYLPRHLPRNA